ncbi:MAG: class IV adenylate cyclase [Acidobacteriia bacterium]|nr:class IV adenylate cyclase [Terriglobia bacterium]
MVQEIEQKLRLPDGAFAQLVEQRCRRLGTGEPAAIVQRDEYFDTSNEDLRKGDFTVRIRQAADRVFVALKGPRIHQPSGVHHRIELEFEVPDPRHLRAQLETQGLIRTAVIDKRRSEFSIQECFVALDTVPFIGSFIEIEGPSAEAIESVRNTLDLSAAVAVKENYTELLEEAFLKCGRPVRPHLVATFEAEASQTEQR